VNYPVVPRTVLYKKYQVVKRLPLETKKVIVYNYNGDRWESWVELHNYIVSDGKFSYKLTTKHNGLNEGDKIKVSFRNGDYKIKKV